MSTIEAVYEGGVFRPVEPVALPEHSRVTLQLHVETSTTPNSADDMDEIYEILNRRYKSGHADTAERHNEHQP